MTWKSRPSIQTVPASGQTASAVAERYFAWVDDRLPGVHARDDGATVELGFFGSRPAAILLQRSPASDDDNVVYVVEGGFLVRRPAGGEFTFSRKDDVVEIALRGFTPRLPRLIYQMTHSLVHAFVMSWFCRHVRVPQLEGKRP